MEAARQGLPSWKKQVLMQVCHAMQAAIRKWEETSGMGLTPEAHAEVMVELTKVHASEIIGTVEQSFGGQSSSPASE